MGESKSKCDGSKSDGQCFLLDRTGLDLTVESSPKPCTSQMCTHGGVCLVDVHLTYTGVHLTGVHVMGIPVIDIS
jgi:hypothetical protein